jgi:hypothetical protein
LNTAISRSTSRCVFFIPRHYDDSTKNRHPERAQPKESCAGRPTYQGTTLVVP